MPAALDIANAFGVSGWALCPDEQTADRVSIEVDGQEVAQIPCSGFRQDLLDAGVSDGRCVYSFLFPEILGFDRPSTVVVRSVSTGKPIGRLPSVVIEHPLCDIAQNTETRAYAAHASSASQKDDIIEIRGRVLAPADAILGFRRIGTRSIRRLARQASFTPFKQNGFVRPTLQISDFLLTTTAPTSRSEETIEFELTDSTSPEAPLASPAARIAIPLTLEHLAAPPAENFVRTSGPTATLDNFFVSGVSTAYIIHSIILKYLNGDVELSILDWGVGCGRIAVPLKRLFRPNSSITGLDVDDVNVSWCKENLLDVTVRGMRFLPAGRDPVEFPRCRVWDLGNDALNRRRSVHMAS